MAKNHPFNFVDSLTPDQIEAVRSLTDDSSARSFISNHDVYVSLLFPLDTNPHRPSSSVIPFKAKELLFLKAYTHETTLEEAAEKAHMSVDQAKRFLNRKETQAFIWDCVQRNQTASYWMEPANCIAEGDKIFRGEKAATKSQMKVWEAFFDRAMPKTTRQSNDSGQKIVINIDPSAVQEAFRRQSIIEGEIAKENHGE